MKVVVDTNILVSSFLSPSGPPSEVVRRIMSGHLRVCYDMRILREYAGVLERPKFHISPVMSAKLLEQIRAAGELISATPLFQPLSDPSDAAFLEVALAANAECLITGNLKHFPFPLRQGMQVFSPAEFLHYYHDPQERSGGTVKSPSARYRAVKRIKKNKKCISARRLPHELTFAEFARKIEQTCDAGDVNWTPEEVERVIHGLRKERTATRYPPQRRKVCRHGK